MGQLLPQHSSLSDRRNVPQSTYGNAEDYAIHQARLLRQSNQTSEHLSNWLAQLSPNLVQELTSAIIRSPLFSQQAGNSWSAQPFPTNPETAEKLKLPKPQPNTSPIEGRPIGFGSFTPHTSRTLGQSHRSVVPVHRSDANHVYRAPDFDGDPQHRQNAPNLGDTVDDNNLDVTGEQTNPMNTSKVKSLHSHPGRFITDCYTESGKSTSKAREAKSVVPRGIGQRKSSNFHNQQRCYAGGLGLR